MKKLNKFGVAPLISPAVFGLGVFLVIGIIIGALAFGGRLGRGTGLTAQELEDIGDDDIREQKLTLTEDVTVTLSSQDYYALGTSAGVAHRIIEFKAVNGQLKKRNKIIADDGTETGAPLDTYVVMIGNKTTSLTANTDYYPVITRGTIPDTGEYEIRKDQYKTGGTSQFTFVFFNENDQVNTDQDMGASTQKTVRWKGTAADNVCIGNPDTGGENAMTYIYPTANFQKVVQLSASGNDQSNIGTPTSITAQSGKRSITYAFPVVCDNNHVERKVRVESTATEPTSSTDINMTVSDVSWDFDADTLALLIGYEDEDSNDIGVADFNVTGLRFS